MIAEIGAQPHGPLFGIQADEVTDAKEPLGVVQPYVANDLQ